MAASHGLVAAATFPRMTSCVAGCEFAMLRMAASHGLIACGDLSEDDFVCRGHEFANLRLAASHGLVAGRPFRGWLRVSETRVRHAAHGCLAWIRTMTNRSRILRVAMFCGVP